MVQLINIDIPLAKMTKITKFFKKSSNCQILPINTKFYKKWQKMSIAFFTVDTIYIEIKKCKF